MKEDDYTLIRHTWWNYYKRGVAWSHAENWENAIRDFKIATGQMKGASFSSSIDRRRAKTYGLHFIDGYFPHREIGVCHLKLGNLEKAEAALKKSLNMTSSARAKHFLNIVKKMQMQAKGIKGNPENFDFDIHNEPLIHYVRTPKFNLKASIRNPNFVSGISINDVPLYTELAKDRIDFEHTLKLKEGKQRIRISAQSLDGTSAMHTMTVFLTLQSPLIQLIDNPEGKGYTILISDDVGLKKVVINNSTIDIKNSPTNIAQPVVLKGKETIPVFAEDLAGNTTSGKVSLPQIEQARMTPIKHEQHIRVAYKLLKSLFDQHEPNSDRRTGSDAATKDILPQRPRWVQKSRAEAQDAIPPVLKLAPKGPKLRITSETFVLGLESQDGNGLKNITVTLNGNSESQRLSSKSPLYFQTTRRFRLAEGDNNFTVTVEDRQGNVTHKTLSVKRLPPAVEREDLRITAQLPPFQETETKQQLNVDLYSEMMKGLLKKPRRFNLVERRPKVLKRLFLEHKLSNSSLADQRKAILKGKIKPSEWLLSGHLSTWPGSKNLELVINVVDVETGEILLSSDAYFTEFRQDQISFKLEGLVGKLKQNLPVRAAKILSVGKRDVVVNLGQQDALTPGMRLLFFSKTTEEIDLATPITQDDSWIQGKLTNISKGKSKAVIQPAKGTQSLERGSKAIIR